VQSLCPTLYDALADKQPNITLDISYLVTKILQISTSKTICLPCNVFQVEVHYWFLTSIHFQNFQSALNINSCNNTVINSELHFLGNVGNL